MTHSFHKLQALPSYNAGSCKFDYLEEYMNELTLTVLVTTIDALGHFETG